MADRRPLSSYPSGNYDIPPATITLSENVSTRLDRLRSTFERHRQDSRAEAEAARQARWGQPPNLRRRRLRSEHSPTYEGRSYPYSEEAGGPSEERPRPVKRRKVDHYSSPTNTKTFKYGHYGQVEAGRLKLSVHSCDGEVYDEKGLYFGPENILRHDQSVYCSKTSRCNIILQHHDKTAFCLEKLHIVAPENGFTAPVKDGFVYVAMDLDELQPLLRDDSSDHLPPPPSPPPRYPTTSRLSLLESLNDPEIARAISQRENRDFSPPLDWSRQANMTSRGDATDYWHERTSRRITDQPTSNWPPLVPTNRHSVNAEHTRPFDDHEQDGSSVENEHFAVLSNEAITWPEDRTPAAILADRQRRERLRRDELDEPGLDPRWSATYRGYRRGPLPEMNWTRRERVLDVKGQGGRKAELTRIRFHIKNGQNAIAIKFDPPVSGTYILLQLQTPFAGKNIDVQTVMASGYAGPRFFPAVQPR